MKSSTSVEIVFQFIRWNYFVSPLSVTGLGDAEVSAHCPVKLLALPGANAIKDVVYSVVTTDLPDIHFGRVTTFFIKIHRR